VKNKKEENPNRERSLFFVRPLQRFIRPRRKPDRTSMLIVVLVVSTSGHSGHIYVHVQHPLYPFRRIVLAEKPKSACIRRLEPKSPIPRKSFVPPHRIILSRIEPTLSRWNISFIRFRRLIGRDVGPEFNYPKQVDEGDGLVCTTMTEETDRMTRKLKGKGIRS
ncbi:LOW QUALITY PROTEIN: hypothetical protein V1478_016003, partial [Vespula squamosa]